MEIKGLKKVSINNGQLLIECDTLVISGAIIQ